MSTNTPAYTAGTHASLVPGPHATTECAIFDMNCNVNTSLVSKYHAPQTKILEGGTKDEIWMFEALFKGVSTRFGLEPLKSQSKIRISSFVLPSKIFVWGA
jgi:hypothetical protein